MVWRLIPIQGAAVDNAEKFNQAVEYMRKIIRREVAAGFDAADRIAEAAVEVASSEGVEPKALLALAEQFTRETLAGHYSAQAEWPDRTDCDRLDEAFAELEDRGIVCRQNFSCCMTCGSGEIWDEMRATEEAGRRVRGYAFFHTQDTDSAVECGGLYLAFGATDDGEAAAVAVAREIVEVLNTHRLKTDWDGSAQYRIGVTIDWKRRRPLEAGFGCRRPSR
jgi:hypothetical protein